MTETLKFSWRSILFGLLLVIALIALAIFLPTEDRAAYFEFVDQRSLLGVPNFLDVTSNFAFLIAGLFGLGIWWQNQKSEFAQKTYFQIILALSIIWTAFGSTYFHLAPGLQTVYWDRLPMVFAFGCIVGWLVADKIHFRSGVLIAAFLIISGSICLTLWKFGLLNLKLYYLLQYGGLVAALLMCAFFPKGHFQNSKFIMAFLIYILAKIAETYDRAVFDTLGVISGHTLKHLIAAYAIWVLLMLKPKKSNQSTL